MQYTMVNPDDSDSVEHKISPSSPVGKAIMDHLIGDKVVVNTPRGNLHYQIRSIT